MSPQARERSFDDLARGLASGEFSRRKALRLMGAAIVGGTLGSLGIRGASADQGDQGENEECKPLNKKCRKDHQCCSGNCDASSGTCAAACLPDADVGVRNPCTSGTQCCSGNCPDGICRGRNLIVCSCQLGGTYTNCVSIACSDATGLTQYCNAPCAGAGGSAPGAHTCVTNACVLGL